MHFLVEFDMWELPNLYGYVSFVWSEFEGVREEVEEYLSVSSLIAIDGFEKRFDFGVYDKLGADLLLFGEEFQGQKCLINGFS